MGIDYRWGPIATTATPIVLTTSSTSTTGALTTGAVTFYAPPQKKLTGAALQVWVNNFLRKEGYAPR